MEKKRQVSPEQHVPIPDLNYNPETLIAAGNQEIFRGNYPEAIKQFEKALRYCEDAGDKNHLPRVYNHLGYVYVLTGDFKTSHACFEKALQLGQETGDQKAIGGAYGNLGILYDEQGSYPLALEYYHKALHHYKDTDDREGIAKVYNNIGIIHFSQDNFPLALDYFNKALAYYEETNDKHTISRILGNVGYIHTSMGNYEQALQLHERERQIKEAVGDTLGLSLTYNYLGAVHQEMGNLSLALDYFQKALSISRELDNTEREVHSLITLSSAYISKKEDARALEYATEAMEKSHQLGNRKFEKESLELLYKINRRQNKIDAALDYLERFMKLKDELQGTETARKIESLKAGYDLELSEKERQLTEKVLNNVLPQSIAARIKKGEEKIIERFPHATVLFADMVGFTSWSSNRDVNEVAEVLDTLFKIFDELAVEHGIEKIKTIGDAYMCVAGLPEPCDDHAERICHMALAMNHQLKAAYPDGEIRLRTGIHTGEVIAGIIGKNKYAYDLWGDTVNTASRMESHSLPEKIQVTEEVVKALGNKFQFEERGEIEVKGKGRMRTWFLKEV